MFDQRKNHRFYLKTSADLGVVPISAENITNGIKTHKNAFVILLHKLIILGVEKLV